jgi:hypothetical protein
MTTLTQFSVLETNGYVVGTKGPVSSKNFECLDDSTLNVKLQSVSATKATETKYFMTVLATSVSSAAISSQALLQTWFAPKAAANGTYLVALAQRKSGQDIV